MTFGAIHKAYTQVRENGGSDEKRTSIVSVMSLFC